MPLFQILRHIFFYHFVHPYAVRTLDDGKRLVVCDFPFLEYHYLYAFARLIREYFKVEKRIGNIALFVYHGVDLAPRFGNDGIKTLIVYDGHFHGLRKPALVCYIAFAGIQQHDGRIFHRFFAKAVHHFKLNLSRLCGHLAYYRQGIVSSDRDIIGKRDGTRKKEYANQKRGEIYFFIRTLRTQYVKPLSLYTYADMPEIIIDICFYSELLYNDNIKKRGLRPLDVIRVENVHKSFQEVLALNGLSMHVAEGETLGLLGPNGSGKTTTVRLLNGVIFADKGEISVFGGSPKTDGQEIRSRTGVVTENAALYENLTAHENLAFFGRLYGLGAAASAKKADELLELFTLNEKRNEKAGNLSTGMKKKLAIGRALVGEPRILFLDEPTSGLDPEAARGIVLLINELKQSRVTVFVCTHNLNEAEHYCDRYVFLDKGAVLEQGTITELEKKYLQNAVIEVEASGEVPKDFGYPYEKEKDRLVIRLGGVKDIPKAVRCLSGAMDVYAVKRQNASLESLYFEIRRRNVCIPEE